MGLTEIFFKDDKWVDSEGKEVNLLQTYEAQLISYSQEKGLNFQELDKLQKDHIVCRKPSESANAYHKGQLQYTEDENHGTILCIQYFRI